MRHGQAMRLPPTPVLTWLLLISLASSLVVACAPSTPSSSQPLLIFAAASLRDVATELAAVLEAEGVRTDFNFAGSNTLAQQAAATPGVDIFLSADARWVEWLAATGRTVPGSSRAVFGNRLVVAARHDAAWAPETFAPIDLAQTSYRALAMADPEGVPAGRYARLQLESLAAPDGGDLWAAVQGRLAPSLDVRAALALVESDPEILGIVYATDTRASQKVRVLYTFEPSGANEIIYWGVLLEGGHRAEAGQRFLELLDHPIGRAILERHGFLPRSEEP